MKSMLKFDTRALSIVEKVSNTGPKTKLERTVHLKKGSGNRAKSNQWNSHVREHSEPESKVSCGEAHPRNSNDNTIT